MKKVMHNKNSKATLVASIIIIAIMIILIIVNLVLFFIRKHESDNLAKSCLEIEDDAMVVNCIEEKANAYDDAGDCVNALKVYDSIPEDRLDKYVLSDLYDEAYSLSSDCEDGLREDYWADKLEALSSQLEGRD